MTNHELAWDAGFARRKAGRILREIASVAALGCFLASWPVRAQGESAAELAPVPPPAALPAPLPAAPPLPPPPNPALDVRAPAPEPPQPSVLDRWWFWTAIGAAAVATVVVVVISTRGHAPPTTDLGNQEFQP